MLKNVIAPIQAWLLSMGQCVGCGMKLDKAKRDKRDASSEKATCRCGRIFIYDTKSKKYRRALFSEI